MSWSIGAVYRSITLQPKNSILMRKYSHTFLFACESTYESTGIMLPKYVTVTVNLTINRSTGTPRF